MTTYSELAVIRERLTAESVPSEAEMAAMAAALPRSVAGRPEAALVLAGLYERLWPYLREPRWPDWRAADLPVRVRIAWLRAEIVNEPAVIRAEPRGELLYQALRQVQVADARRPDQLVAEVAYGADPVLHGEALRLAREGLHAACLSPALVRKHVLDLLSSDGDDVVASALELLAEPWAALRSLPADSLAGFLTPDAAHRRPRVADAALAAACRHGHSETLWRVVENSDVPSGLRRRALELFGDVAERGHVPGLIATAAQDPLLFGGPLVVCLRGLHRRGHFMDDGDVPVFLGIALADHTIPASQVSTIVFVNRQAVFRDLMDAPLDDPCWPRRLNLLVALDAQEPGEVPVGEAITRILPLVRRPEPFLAAIRVLRYQEAEEAVIALLPSTPAAALSALEAIGGRRSVAALRAGLGLAPGPDPSEDSDVIAPYLRANRNQALEILWHLTRDLGERHALLDRLDPADLPPRIAADLGGPDEREMVLLRSHLDPDKPVAALCRLAGVGGVGTVPLVSDLLLRIVAELAAWWAPESPGWRLDSEPQTGEPVAPQEVVDALRDMGRRLHGRRKIRPLCLLDAPTPEAAGDALVATMALDLVERPGISAPEVAILLELLVRVPFAGTRSRVHRLLRHPDRHVRKHAVELVARDASGDGAQALSASLIRLAASQDAPTVRQTLLALDRARARWASDAITACLDHPVMNVKKTAAEALIRAGSPAAVPKLVFWLGHHDNPGFRVELVRALRAILGSGYAATLVAAAEAEGDDRARLLLLDGLDGEISVSSVLALEDQGSAVVPALLASVASGDVEMLSGSVDALAPVFARHGVSRPASRRPLPSAEADEAVSALLAAKWDASIALRIAGMSVLPQGWKSALLRPRLGDWLRLAAAESVVRARLPQLFPAPWSVADLAAFAAQTPVLLDALAEDKDRGWFVSVLAALVPQLSSAEKLAIADAVRAVRPSCALADTGSSAGETTLTLLRRCGVVLVRGDVELALAEAGLRPDPSRAQVSVLRDVFTSMPSSSQSSATSTVSGATDAADAWRADLVAAIRTRNALEAFRQRASPPLSSRECLDALIDVFASAGSDVRTALLDWMIAVQPLDVPAWTLAEAALAAEPTPRVPADVDLDQPRSAALRERLLAMLASPTPAHRHAVGWDLLQWPEPAIRLAVLGPYLRGELDVNTAGRLALAARTLSAAELQTDGILPEKVLIAATPPFPRDTELLIPLALKWWQEGSRTLRLESEAFLRLVEPDLLAEVLCSRLEAGEWGFARLLSGRSLLRTPALADALGRLRLDGHVALADSIRLVDGPLRGPDAKRDDAAALAVLRDRSLVPIASQPPSREELIDLARSGRPEQIRRALLRLVEIHAPGQADADVRDLLAELLTHPKPRVRLQAQRTARQLLDRGTYLRLTSILLTDSHPDVVRTAVRTVSHAAWEPAVPAVVALLEHPQAAVRAEASSGLVRMGEVAVGALRRAADHARPDKRGGYVAVLALITAEEGGGGA